MKKFASAAGLFLLAPLIAEYLLGDFPITVLFPLILLGPTYGGAALLIRELARRFDLGWPSIVLLGLAYGVIEEGLMTQSLFNPNYAGAHLLEHGFIPALGIAVPWTMFVLTLHTVWSISAPIAIVEEMSLERRTTPWLGKIGLAVTAILAFLGAAATTVFTYVGMGRFMASIPQLATVVIIAAVLIVVAFRLRPARTPGTGRAPSAWLVLATALVAGVVFEAGWTWLPTWIGVVALGIAELGMAVIILVWSRKPGWGPWHRLALASGAILTYAWHGFFTNGVMPASPAVMLASHVIFAAGALALLVVAALRVRRAATVTA